MPTSSDHVAKELIKKIRNGEFRVGQALPSERELSTIFATSRPTIRAALITLQARGYASHEVNHRPRAQHPSVASIMQAAGKGLGELLGQAETTAYVDQVRQFIEVGAVRAAARQASNVEVVQISAALEKCYECIGDDDSFSRADADFHRSIVSVLQNPIMLELHDMFVFEMVIARPRHGDQLEKNRLSYEEHRKIYEAIAASDSETAMHVMDEHLARAYRARLPRPARLEGHIEEGTQ